MTKTMEDKIFGAGCNYLWGLLQGLKKTAIRSLELAGGDEELAREAYEKYVDEEKAVDALKSGEYVLTRAMFDDAFEDYIPSPKEAVVRELNAFEEAQKRQRSDQC